MSTFGNSQIATRRMCSWHSALYMPRWRTGWIWQYLWDPTFHTGEKDASAEFLKMGLCLSIVHGIHARTQQTLWHSGQEVLIAGIKKACMCVYHRISSYTIVYPFVSICHHSLSTRMYQGRFSRSLALTASATELEVQGWDPLTWRQASDIGLFGILLTMQRRFQFTLGVLRNALPGSKSPGRLHSCGHPFRSRVLGGNRNKV